MAAGMVTQMMPHTAPAPAVTAVTQTVNPVQPAPVVVTPAPYTSPLAGVAEYSRGLTAGEATLARQIFGKALNPAAIKLHFYSGTQAVTAGSQDAANIEVYGIANASADYSTGDTRSYGLFVNELARLWQNGEGDHLRAVKGEGSTYTLKEELDIINYSPAQQRAMVEDYALRFFHPAHKSFWLPQVHKRGDTSETDAILRSMVENRLYSAKESHLALRQSYAREMTADETALVKDFFGSELRAGQVKIYQYPYERKDALASVETGYGANFWGAANSAADFTKSDSARLGTFMHEMTHVWQNQTYQKHTPNQTMKQYDYWLDAKSTYTDYSVEQQAAMVEDYVGYFLQPAKAMRYMPETYSPAEFPAKTAMLKKVVEAQFPGAKVLREAYQAPKLAPRLKAPGVA